MSEKNALRIQTADELETVYYEALQFSDIEVMSALWADEDVICVHPGSGLIRGYDTVVRSWRHIFENAGNIQMRYSRVSKLKSDELAVHLVTEEIMQGQTVVAVVIATNVYKKFSQGWLMVEHHASLVQQDNSNQTLQ